VDYNVDNNGGGIFKIQGLGKDWSQRVDHEHGN